MIGSSLSSLLGDLDADIVPDAPLGAIVGLCRETGLGANA